MEDKFTVDITISNIPDSIYDELLEKIESAMLKVIEDLDDINNPEPITLDIGVGQEQI